MSLHSGNKPFSCDYCTRSFVNRFDLKKHKEKNHPAEVEAEKENETIAGTGD